MEASRSFVSFPKTPSDVSRDTDVVVTLCAKSSTGGPDISLGNVKVSPNFTDQSIQDDWFVLHQAESEIKVGEVHLQLGFKQNGVQSVGSLLT